VILKTANKLELFEVYIKDGKLPFTYTQAIKEALAAMEGKAVDVVIKLHRKTRSCKQNAYLQGVVYPMINDAVWQLTGERYTTNDDIADDVKIAVGWYTIEKRVKNFGVQEVAIPKRSKNLNTSEFQEYCNLIRGWAFDFLKINIPDPDGKPWDLNEIYNIT